MNLDEIRILIQADVLEADRLIHENLASEVPLIQQIGEYVFHSGGKRARLILTLLSARVCGLQGKNPKILGAIIEMIHTATLLHDDVIDQSALRRGRMSANAAFGNTATVLSGDFLYSRSFELMVKLDDLSVLGELAKVSNQIAEGEMRQLQNAHCPDLTEADYLAVIQAKTAALFEAAAKIPAMMAGAKPQVIEALAHFGCAVGIAFQILDDLMDYTSDAAKMGKNPGDDLSEGKMTLPLIYAKNQALSVEKERVDAAIRGGDRSQLSFIIQLIQQTDTIAQVHAYAEKIIAEAKAGLAILPQNEYVDALCAFADLAIERHA